jgi:ubiquinone biosynthesis monooxygenase Coq7
MLIDKFIGHFDQGLRVLFAPARSVRAHPDAALDEGELSSAEKRHALGLMRVNHCGEICAQALYQGQAMTEKNPDIKQALQQASLEEEEHLAWTAERVAALGGSVSLFNPIWYTGSLAMGISVGLLGRKWNLGFLEATEKQVCAHLDHHLETLPVADVKSRAVVSQMRIDEAEHAQLAKNLGAANLPKWAELSMNKTAKIMTTLSYYR